MYMCNNNNIEKGLKTNQEITEENRKKKEKDGKNTFWANRFFSFAFQRGVFFFFV